MAEKPLSSKTAAEIEADRQALAQVTKTPLSRAEKPLSSKTAAEIEADRQALAQVTKTPLSRDAFIDPVTGAERPINNPVTNPNYAADVAKNPTNKAINNKIDAIAHDTTIDPAVKMEQIKTLKSQKLNYAGVDPAMRQQLAAESSLPQNQYKPIERDIEAETRVMNKHSLDPNDPQDVASGLGVVYQPNQITQLINSGQVDASVFSAKKLQDLGIAAERIQQLASQETDPARRDRLTSLYQQLQQLQQTGAMGQQIESTLNATPKPTNQMMGVLSEALNAKNNFKNQQLGTSDLFKQAGLSGYSVLAQSLNQRRNEMADKSKSAQNYIAEVGGAMASTYKAIAENYDNILKRYNEQMDMLLDLDAEARENEQAMALLDKQAALEKEMYEWKKGVDAKYSSGDATPKFDEDGNFMGYWDENSRTFVEADGTSKDVADAINSNESGWSVIGTALKDIFYQPGKGDYGNGEGKRQCGEAFNDITDGKKVGDSYASKMACVTKRTDPKAGNGLVIPLVQGTGHIETVTWYDKKSDKIQTISWNRDGKGTATVQEYKISDLQAKYGDNWGFTDSKLKPKYAEKLNKQSNVVRQTIAGATAGSAGGTAGAIAGGVAGAISGVAGALGSEKSLEDQYFDITNDSTIYNPKSSVAKDFNSMTDAKKKQHLDTLRAKEKAKAPDVAYLKERGQYLIDTSEDKITRDDVYFSLAEDYGREIANQIADSLTYKK